MYLAPGAFAPPCSQSCPVHHVPDHWPRGIWILQKGELFPSLWISQSGSPLALQAWGSAEREPARPPAPSGTQCANSILGKEKDLFPAVTLVLACVYWWQQGQLLLGLAVPRKVHCIQLIRDWEKSAWTSALNFTVCVVLPLQSHVKPSHWTTNLAWP